MFNWLPPWRKKSLRFIVNVLREAGQPVPINLLERPHCRISIGSRGGKSFFLVQAIRQMKRDCPHAKITVFDFKGSEDFPDDIIANVTMIDTSVDFERAEAILRELETENTCRSQAKKTAGVVGELQNLWAKDPASLQQFPPIWLIVDEAPPLLAEVDRKAPSAIDELRTRFQNVLKSALMRFATNHIAVWVVTQTARAGQFKTLDGAQDNWMVKIYGACEKPMAESVGYPELATDPRYSKRGTFLLVAGTIPRAVTVIPQKPLKIVQGPATRPAHAVAQGQGGGDPAA